MVCDVHASQNVYHKFFNIVCETTKRNVCEGNKEENQSNYKDYTPYRTKEPSNYVGFKYYNNPPKFQHSWICQQMGNHKIKFQNKT